MQLVPIAGAILASAPPISTAMALVVMSAAAEARKTDIRESPSAAKARVANCVFA